jgi:hypothetical protein
MIGKIIILLIICIGGLFGGFWIVQKLGIWGLITGALILVVLALSKGIYSYARSLDGG